MADFSQMMNDPQMRQKIMALAGQKGRPQGMGGIRGPANSLSNLADAYPKLKAQSEQMKLEEQKRKLKKMEFDMLLKKAEQAYKLKEQQMQMAQGQARIQAAQQSV